MINIIIFSTSPLRLYALLESLDLFWKDHPKPTAICKYDVRYNHITGADIFYSHDDFSDIFEAVRKPNCEHLLLTDDVLFTNNFPDDIALSNSDTIGHCLYMDNGYSIFTDTKYSISKFHGVIMWLSGVIIRDSDIPWIACKTFDEFANALFYHLNYECYRKFLTFKQKSCCGRLPQNKVYDDKIFPEKKIDIRPFYYVDNFCGNLVGEYATVWKD